MKPLHRLLDIWAERKLFPQQFITELKNPIIPKTSTSLSLDSIDHPLAKYLLRMGNEPGLIEPFNIEDIDSHQIEKISNDLENKKNDLIMLNQEREEYMIELGNEQERQQNYFDQMMSQIDVMETRIESVKAMKKRVRDESFDESHKAKKEKREDHSNGSTQSTVNVLVKSNKPWPGTPPGSPPVSIDDWLQ